MSCWKKTKPATLKSGDGERLLCSWDIIENITVSRERFSCVQPHTQATQVRNSKGRHGCPKSPDKDRRTVWGHSPSKKHSKEYSRIVLSFINNVKGVVIIDPGFLKGNSVLFLLHVYPLSELTSSRVYTLHGCHT